MFSFPSLNFIIIFWLLEHVLRVWFQYKIYIYIHIKITIESQRSIRTLITPWRWLCFKPMMAISTKYVLVCIEWPNLHIWNGIEYWMIEHNSITMLRMSGCSAEQCTHTHIHIYRQVHTYRYSSHTPTPWILLLQMVSLFRC